MYALSIVYILAFFVAVYINYLIRKSQGLSVSAFVLLMPGVFGAEIVWLYGRMKKKKSN